VIFSVGLRANAKAGTRDISPKGVSLRERRLGPRRIAPSCPKNSRRSRFEECRAAQKPEAAVQEEQEDAMNSRNFDRRNSKELRLKG